MFRWPFFPFHPTQRKGSSRTLESPRVVGLEAAHLQDGLIGRSAPPESPIVFAASSPFPLLLNSATLSRFTVKQLRSMFSNGTSTEQEINFLTISLA
jgi:hypothetical protein